MKVIPIFMILLFLVLLTGIALADTNKTEYIIKVNFDKKSLKMNDSLTSFDTVTPDTEAFKKAAEKGKVKLTLLGKDFELKLEPTNIESNNAKIIMENETGIYFVKAPHVDTYSGTVNGSDDSTVSLAVADDVLIGSIMFKNKTYIIDQTNSKKDGKTIHVVYDLDTVKSSKGYLICDVDDKGTEAGRGAETNNLSSEGITSALSSSSLTEVDILPCYDQGFADKYSNPIASILSMISKSNEEYSHANVNFKVYYFKKYGYLDNTNTQNALYSFARDIEPYRQMVGADLGVLFSGRVFTADSIGTSFPYNGSSKAAYSVLQMLPEAGYKASFMDRCGLLAHEVGHNFGATHGKSFIWYPDTNHVNHTLMNATLFGFNISAADRNLTVFQFSDPSRHGDTYHNNLAILSSNKYTVAGFKPRHINIDTAGVYNNQGTWALWNMSSGSPVIVGFGWSGTKPVVGDWDNDGEKEVGIYDPVGYRFLLRLDSGSYRTINLGSSGVTPVIGDWDGDGDDEPGVYNNGDPGTWVLWINNYPTIVGFGWAGVTPLVGDWDGDAATEVGVYNPGGSNFLFRIESNLDPLIIPLGWNGVTPVVGHWNEHSAFNT